jgi:hypothetical protein
VDVPDSTNGQTPLQQNVSLNAGHATPVVPVHLQTPATQLLLQHSAFVVHASPFATQHCVIPSEDVFVHAMLLQQSAALAQPPEVAAQVHTPPLHVPEQQSLPEPQAWPKDWQQKWM